MGVRNIVSASLRLLYSLRFAVWVLFVIAALSVVGTVFMPLLSLVVPPSIGAGSWLSRIISLLELDDIFHSRWLFILGAVLLVSLLSCSGRRVRAVGRIFLGKRDRAVDRQALSPLAAVCIHMGVAIIIGGFLYGQFAGFTGYVEVPEGRVVSLDSVIPPEQGGGTNRAVRCDDFSVEFYDSGIPSEYRSAVSFITGDKVVKRGVLRVNQPLIVDRIRYYQAHYNTLPLAVVAVEHDGETMTFAAYAGDVFELGKEAVIRVARIEDNFMNLGPAVRIDFVSQNEQGYVWAFLQRDDILRRFPEFFSRFPQFDPHRFESYRFFFQERKSMFATGLSISYDPGIAVVIVGSVLLLVGLFALYCVPAVGTRLPVHEATQGPRDIL